MASLLPSAIASTVANAFRGKLLTGTLRRESVASVNSKGDPVAGSPSLYSVQGIIDNFSALFITLNNVPATDVRVLLIMNLTQPFTEPVQDDLIQFRDTWFKVRRVVERDPANASISLQCFKTEAPA